MKKVVSLIFLVFSFLLVFYFQFRVESSKVDTNVINIVDDLSNSETDSTDNHSGLSIESYEPMEIDMSLSEDDFSSMSSPKQKPQITAEPYSPTDSLDLDPAAYTDDLLGSYFPSENCQEIEVPLSQLEGHDFPPEQITENNTVILIACEE